MSPDLRKKIDRILDTLWAGGVTNPVTYIEQLSYLLYLKLLDEEEVNRERFSRVAGDSTEQGNSVSLFPQTAQRYRWRNWRFYSGPKLRDFIRDEVFPYMASLVREELQVAEYFKDAVLEITDPNVLKLVVDEIDAIELQKLGPDVKGDIFEYLLTHLGQSALNGQFRTPRQIRSLMVEALEPEFGDLIYDPVCGTAGFLIDAVDFILAKYSDNPSEVPIYGEEWLDRQGLSLEEAKAIYPQLLTYRHGSGERIPSWPNLEASIFGVDVSRQMMRISMMNLVLHGVRRANLKRANSLSELGGLTEADLRRRYDVILSNPPFAGVLPKDSIRPDLPTKSTKSELLFLGLMMSALKPGGRCAVVVPEGLLFGTSHSHVDLREKLIKEFDLLAVVSLPGNVFRPYAGVKTSILIFRRPHVNAPPRTKRKLWFYDIVNDGYSSDRLDRGGRAETPEKNDIPAFIQTWRDYKASGFQVPPGVEGEAELDPGEIIPPCWWVEEATISQQDYVLSANRYRPRTSVDSVLEDPLSIAKEIAAVELMITREIDSLIGRLDALVD
jgi:type I restriction enzyme M protein